MISHHFVRLREVKAMANDLATAAEVGGLWPDDGWCFNQVLSLAHQTRFEMI